MNLYWLPEALRAVGIKVVTYPGWESRSHGEIREPLHVIWHHDASPVGDSPSVPESMIRRWDVAAAPVWVDRYGAWHIIGSGVAWHAGRVLPGKPGNWNSVGIETDHTTGEDWPPALLDSLRRGTAAIFRKVGRSPDPALEFHKTVCRPVGRKVDPDGLDLDQERAAVAALMSGVEVGDLPAPKPAPKPDGGVNVAALPLIRRGAKGADVKRAQGLLLANGVGVGSAGIDGDFGPATDRAARTFQSRVGIGVDGIVGPVTWSRLLGV